MDIINDIVEHYLLSTKPRFKKVLLSPKSHRKVVIETKDKERIIFVPCKAVKLAQRYIIDKYLSEIKYSDCAYAYTKNKSIVDMANHHLGNKHFLHLDIKHFFDNMNWDVFVNAIQEYFSKTQLFEVIQDKTSSKDLKQILTFRQKFRQGSVTSPYISNIYLYQFDNLMNQYVLENIKNGKYSRYSDDIFISSTDRIDGGVINFVKSTLKRYKLRLNYKKIHYFSIDNHVNITGITITSDNRLTINTKYKKSIKALVYKTINHTKGFKPNFNVVYGYIYYLIMCDPNYFNYLQTKYSNKENGLLMLDELKRIEKETAEKNK